MTNSSDCFRSDEGGRLSFLRTRTLGDRIRDTRTWARNRRSSSDKELTPGKEPPPDTAPRTAAETNGCGPPSLPGVAEVEEAGDHDTSASSTGDPSSIPGLAAGAEMASSSPGPGSRLSRIFSLRRTSEPPAFNERTHPELMQPLQEEDESLLGSLSAAPMSAPPSLPPPPQLMSADQTKRRFIINSLVQSENNYLDSLGRLIADYKVPLEESSPPILSDPKVATMFYRVPEIQQIHSQFRIALTEAVKNWDEVNNPPRNLLYNLSFSEKTIFGSWATFIHSGVPVHNVSCTRPKNKQEFSRNLFQDEKIGDVFVASFSKSVVLEVYADFINNFSEAMDLAKCESKRKSAFGDFLKVQIFLPQKSF